MPASSVFWPVMAVVSIAALVDLRCHRIPNAITLPAIVLAYLMHGSLDGISGLIDALAGSSIGLLLLLPFYIKRAMGAGDVKLMAAVGAFLGPQNALVAVAATLIAGALMAIGLLLARGGLGDLLQRYWLTLKYLVLGGVSGGKAAYIAPESGSTAAARFPYGLAIAAGSLWACWLSVA